MSLELQIAKRFFDSKRGFISVNALFSTIGIALGVAALVIVIAIMNGFRDEISKKFIGANGDIIIQKFGSKALSISPEELYKITQLPEVKSYDFISSGQALATGNSRSIAVEIRGINDLKNKPLIYNNIWLGSEKNFGKNKVAIGFEMASNLGLMVGDRFKIMVPSNITTIVGNIPRSKVFEVGLIFRSGMYLYDQSLIFADLEQASKVFSLENANFLEINLKETNSLNAAKLKVKEIFKDRQFMIKDWQEMNLQIFNALKTEKAAMFSILTLIVIVASFNIISSLVMLVNSKMKNIAILRSFGMSSNAILRIFIFCGLFIGVLGVFIGVMLGILISSNIDHIKGFLEKFSSHNLFDPVIYYLSYLPSKLHMPDVMFIAIISLLLSLVATIFPAIKASKMNIIEVLKGS